MPKLEEKVTKEQRDLTDAQGRARRAGESRRPRRAITIAIKARQDEAPHVWIVTRIGPRAR